MPLADDFDEDLKAAKAAWDDDETSGLAAALVTTEKGAKHPALLDGSSPEQGLARALIDAISTEVELPHAGWVLLTLTVENDEYAVQAAAEGLDGPIRIRFDDGSERVFSAPTAVELEETIPATDSVSHQTDARLAGRESGVALLEPVTAVEYQTIEIVIGILREIINSGQLDEVQHWKAQGALELLEDTHRGTEVGQSERQELWVTTKRVIRYLRKELPVDIAVWTTAFDALARVWPNLTEILRAL